jgi:hypothetical protein
VALIGCAAGGGLAGCDANDPVYVPATMAIEVNGEPGQTMGMTGIGGASGAGSFGAKGTVALRLRASTAGENRDRQALQQKLAYPVPLPEVREDRFHVEVRYTVTNLGDAAGTFTLHVDGANEFTRYDEDAVATAFAAANQDSPFFGLIEPTPETLAPGGIFQGIVREDDFHEAALDLDAMGRFMAPFQAVIVNRSEVNAIGLEMLPAGFVRPALWEVTVQVAATQHMTCQLLVRIRDDDNRLLSRGADEFVPQPATFAPTIPPRR